MIISGEVFFPVSLQYFLSYNPIDIFLHPFTSIYYPALKIVGKSMYVEENSTNMPPSAAKIGVPIFLLLKGILGDFLGHYFAMISTACLFFLLK
jgi:hypothetical protein